LPSIPQPTPPDEAQPTRRWRTYVLVAAVATLIVWSAFRLQGDGGKASQAPARQYLTVLQTSRAWYALKSKGGAASSTFEDSAHRLMMSALNDGLAANTANAWRRLALIQYLSNDPAWKSSVGSLRQYLVDQPALEADRELAMWGTVFAKDKITVTQAEEFASRVDGMNLGWFGVLAHEAIYTNAGDTAKASELHEIALRSSRWMQAVTQLYLAAVLIGLSLGIWLLDLARRRRRDPEAPIPRWMKGAPQPDLTRQQADALYTVFVVYMASMLIGQGASGLIGRVLGAGTTNASPPEMILLLSMGLRILTIAPAVLVFFWVKKKTGIGLFDVGFRRCQPVVEGFWGIGGYLVSLPILIGASIVSAWLFRNFHTPLNPAITAFAGSQSLVVQIGLFIDAAVVAPLIEETMFRGVFFRSLSPRMGRPAAALVSAGIFAALHPQLPLGFPGLFCLAMLFTALYAHRGTLMPSIVAHGVNNAAIFFLLEVLLR
jgi:membrane protease YdiL (CAAX protease family)